MAIQITKVDVWVGEIVDQAGGLAEKLEALAGSGASLEFLIARRKPDKPGTGIVFVAPLKGAAQTRAAKKAGLSKTNNMHSLRLEMPDRASSCAKVARAIADAGINLRGMSAAALGRQSVVYFSFNSGADAKKAGQVLKKALSSK